MNNVEMLVHVTNYCTQHSRHEVHIYGYNKLSFQLFYKLAS